MLPISRTEGVTVKSMGDEVVLFDSTNGGIHHLNRIATVVWRSCDGRTDRPALERIVTRTTNIADVGPAVELALEQLSSRGLLNTNISRANDERRRDRRETLKQLAAAAAIPFIMTCTANRARAQSESQIQPQACTITCRGFGPDPAPGIPGPAIFITVDGTVASDGSCTATCPPQYTRV
jgi:hypothetical protein